MTSPIVLTWRKSAFLYTNKVRSSIYSEVDRFTRFHLEEMKNY